MTNPRFASIGSILNRTATDPETSASDAAQPKPQDPAAASAGADQQGAAGAVPPAPARRQRPTSKQPPSPESDKASGGVRRVAFRLDPALHTALVARAAAENVNHGQIVLDSVEAAHRAGKLSDLVANGGTAEQAGGLFPRLPTPGPVQPTIPVEIRLHAQAVVVLDQLAEQHGAPSRTQLLVAALRHHLS